MVGGSGKGWWEGVKKGVGREWKRVVVGSGKGWWEGVKKGVGRE